MQTPQMPNDQLKQQRHAIMAGPPILPVEKPCRLGDGILLLSEEEQERLRTIARTSFVDVQFFIPASGSGSRMFSFLEEFLEQPSAEGAQQAERFFSKLPAFSFFSKLPSSLQNAYFEGTLALHDLIRFLLDPDGLNFGQIPKGLIPFHVHEPITLNAFQEHLAQGANLTMGTTKYHFTIQQEFEYAFIQAQNELSALTNQTYDLDFSTQDKNTDAFVFDAQFELLIDADGSPLRRPAGHGTLLQNLAALKAPYILVKNIDNVQHFSQKQQSVDNWRYLLGLQMDIRSQLSTFLAARDFEGLIQWNAQIGLFDPENLRELNVDAWTELLNRPLRVCGMVRNNGQPGGGPFWLQLNGQNTKQIVEKTQLVGHPQMSQLMLQSAYFNPVLMVLSPCDLNNQPHDLTQFADPESYFVVEKTQQGKKVQFVEQPGLWNGAMAKWNTLFVEVPSEVFSPVKTVLDLLEFAHLANKGA